MRWGKNSNLANFTTATDLFEEAKAPGFRIVVCDRNTLNSPATSGLFSGNISGYAFITMKPSNDYGHIVFVADGTNKIYQTTYRIGKWSAWEYLNPNPDVKEKGTYTSEGVVGVTGWISSAGKDCVVYIPMIFSNNVTTIAITKIMCSLRHSGGGYVGGTINIDLTSYLEACSIVKNQGLIYVKFTNQDGWGLTNNTPVSGVCTVTYTLS